MEKDLISVIVPVYKVENYLEKCVYSIINQTYKNLEIILVDDGSPDACPRMCDDFCKIDKRVKVIHKENGGLSDARNRGLDESTGDYIMFVDSDDYIDECMIEKLYMSILRYNSSMAICNFSYEKNGLCDETINCNLPIQDGVLSGYEILTKKMLEKKYWYWVVACCKLYKRSLFDTIRFPVGKIHEDEFIVHKVYLCCQRVSCVSEPMYYYVQNNESIMHKVKNIRKLDIVEALFQRAKDLCEIEEYSNISVEYLIQGLISFYAYYKIGRFPVDHKHREKNHLLLIEYRKVFSLIKKNNVSIPFYKWMFLSINYIDLFIWAWPMNFIIQIKRKLRI